MYHISSLAAKNLHFITGADNWRVDLEDRDVYVVYTLAVHPNFLKKGVGIRLMEFALEYGRKMKAKAICLDVYKENVLAIRLYKQCGFQYIDTVDLGYGEYGLDQFELYQKRL